ncbi:MAG: TIGR03986 family CRISPR-associated RAMP protein [Blastocatellia bacterium]
MSLPKHRNPTRRDRIATAPYNFIPLPDKVVAAVNKADDLPDHNTYTDSNYPNTGYFEVTLTTKSPLYIRCPITEEKFKQQEQDKNLPFRDQVKNTPEFFYTTKQEQPVIPGSSLRGMLRSLLEIVSYGKMDKDKFTDKNLIYRAVGDTSSLGISYRDQTLGSNQANLPNMFYEYPSLQLKGGYLEGHSGNWAIRPATIHQGESFVHVEYKDVEKIIGGRGRQLIHNIFVQPVSRKNITRSRSNLILNLAITNKVSPTISSCPSGMVVAKLIESGHMSNKHMHCAIYEKDTSASLIPIPREMWQLYEEDRDLTRGLKTRKLRSTGDPLFYLLDQNNNLVFFGPTMLFRLPYKQSIKNFIPAKISQSQSIDYADTIFGFVGRVVENLQNNSNQSSKEKSYASRVFVTDAKLAKEYSEEQLWLTSKFSELMIPKILASPKPTSFQNYLVQTNNDDKKALNHYDSSASETVIRGYKKYWHQNNKTANQIRAKHPSQDPTVDLKTASQFENVNGSWQVRSSSTQHTQFKPLRPEVEFKFKIHFENLSDKELGAMCWILNPPNNDPSKPCYHHLGMGKPLGMGAVKLDAELHLVNRQERYKSLFSGDNWQLAESKVDQTTLQDLIKEFEQDILGKLGEKHTSLSDVERIKMLLKMMEWPGPQLDQTNYMEIKQFKDRPVLPDPLNVGEKISTNQNTTLQQNKTSAPTISNKNSQNSYPDRKDIAPISQNKGIAKQQNYQTAKKLEDKIQPSNNDFVLVMELNKKIGRLGSQEDIKQMDEIVTNIAKLPNIPQRKDLIRSLRTWLESRKLWQNKKSMESNWYKKLEELLK